MTILADKVALKLLEVTHPEYDLNRTVWETIADLREGGARLLAKAAKYIPKRPGEESDIYSLRLAKFSYTPVMAKAIREFTAKLSSSPVHVTGIAGSFWGAFLEGLDGKTQDQPEFLNRLFSSLLYFGKVYLVADRPALGITPRSLAEDPENSKPYLLQYEPLTVTNWGEGWVKTRQTLTRSVPLGEALTVHRWTFYDSEHINVYEAETKPGRSIPTTVSKVRTVAHQIGKLPVVSLELPSEMWVGNQVYLKQLQHTRVESSWTDAGTIAGTVQRVFTPTPPKPADDPRVAYDAPDYSEMNFGSAHVLVGSKFEFVESTGQAIAALSGQLDKIEQQIRDLVSMGYLEHSRASQSGKAKEVDMSILTDSMRSYGRKVAQGYQDGLQLIAIAAKLEADKPNVTGLDTYGVSTLADSIDLTVKMLPFIAQLPATAIKLWLGKLTELLTGTVTPEVLQEIQRELDSLDVEALTPKVKTEPKTPKKTEGKL